MSSLTSSSARRALLGAAALTTALVTTGATALMATGASATAHQPAAKTSFKSKPAPPKSTTPTTNETPPKGNVTIYEEGSSLMYPLFQEWAPAYHSHYSNVTIDPAAGGSGKGITDAAGGVVNIGASDAYLSSSQVSEYPGLKNIALAVSSQMVNYNVPGISGSVHLKLTGQVVSEIYQGKITMWNDNAIASLNPGMTLPADKIIAVHREDSSGDTFIFSSYLSAADPKGWGSSIGYGTNIAFPGISNAASATGNGGMVSTCQATPGCIAYIGISYQSKTQGAGLGEAELANASGRYELPTPQTVEAEAMALESKTPANEALSLIYDSAPNGYPIINYEYAIIPPKENGNNQAAAVKAFLYWAVDPAKGSSSSFLSAVNFQPLPATVVALTDAQIAEIQG
ncbi:MAG TPA: phosphate ABC transporter substrate-binding protein PstS [Acidimicrobiales bacterium]|nr:phosphate ABC transporter substrate-binding protein PstS [Acidimicrobiales bacterium]